MPDIGLPKNTPIPFDACAEKGTAAINAKPTNNFFIGYLPIYDAQNKTGALSFPAEYLYSSGSYLV